MTLSSISSVDSRVVARQCCWTWCYLLMPNYPPVILEGIGV